VVFYLKEDGEPRTGKYGVAKIVLKKTLNNLFGNENRFIFVFNKNLNHEQRKSIRSSK